MQYEFRCLAVVALALMGAACASEVPATAARDVAARDVAARIRSASTGIDVNVQDAATLRLSGAPAGAVWATVRLDAILESCTHDPAGCDLLVDRFVSRLVGSFERVAMQ